MTSSNDTDTQFLTRTQARRELHIGSAALQAMINDGLKTVVVGATTYTTRRWIREYQDEHARVLIPAATSTPEPERPMNARFFSVRIPAT